MDSEPNGRVQPMGPIVEAKQVNLGGKTLQQYLEQLRIAVALGQREAANLRGQLK